MTIFRTRYKARYRETDPSGQANTLIIDFYDSGNIKEVMVFGQGEMMYNAQYNDAADKPYEIRTRTKDKKYYSVLERKYDFSTGKVVETFRYQDQETRFWIQ